MELQATYALLVPCYNASAFLPGFLANLALLTVTFDEVIFYDDGSSDDTFDQLAARGCRVIKGLTNRGPGYARNQLAEAAASEYIHFHDIDDELMPGFLESIDAKILTDRPDVVAGAADWIDAVSREVCIRWQYTEAEYARDPLAYFITHPLGIINTVYRRSVFLRVNGFVEALRCWEDADLHVRLAAAKAKFSIIPDLLAVSLRHDRGVSSDQGRCWHCRLLFLRTYMAAYPQIRTEIFENELEKAKNGLIAAGGFRYLREIFRMKRDFHLQLKTRNIRLLYFLGTFVPRSRLLNFVRLLQKSKQ